MPRSSTLDSSEKETHKIAVVQMNSGDDVAANLAQASKFIAAAASQGAGLIVLPETFAFIGKSNDQQLEIAEREGDGRIQNFLARQAAQHDVWLVGGTVPLISPDQNRVYAACKLYDAHGRQVANYHKIHLFDVLVQARDEQYQESAVFYPGDQTAVADTPFGKLGLAVCYDLRFPEMFRLLADQGAEIVAVPAAFTAETGAAHWHTLLEARAVENLAYVAAAGQVGVHVNRRKTYGHSTIIGPWGETLANLDAETGTGLAAVDISAQRRIREDFPCLRHRVFKVTV